MEQRILGSSDLRISVISFGTWGIGGPPWWTRVEDDTAIAALRRAFDLGINCFDTAPVYGMGHAEEVTAKALGAHRHEVIYATKVGQRWKEQSMDSVYTDLTTDSIRFDIEQTLRRMRTDYIDLYQVHWPDPRTPISETFMTLADLQREGKIRWIGVSNFTVEMMEEARKYATLVSLQPRYSLLDVRIEAELLPYCNANEIGVLPYSPLASGLLTGKYTRQSTFEHDWRSRFGDMYKEGALERNLDIVDALRPIAEDVGCTLAELAIAWVIAQDGVTSALVGANSALQIEQNVRAADVQLDEEMLGRIRDVITPR